MKILIVPDSFKGSLTSRQVCLAISQGITESNKDANIKYIPFADGGEGFANCLADIMFANKVKVDCHNIFGENITAEYYIKDKTAIIETAAASGILERLEVMKASSYGTGELIAHAINQGCNEIILGLGGSGSCDCAVGALCALGAKFYAKNSSEFKMPKGEDMQRICRGDFTDALKITEVISFTFACDVTNTLYGKEGAAFVFAPQKGASDDDVICLDNGLRNMAKLLPNDISKLPGSGAAGGICAGLYAITHGKIESGFDVLSKACHLEEQIESSDIIVTGEGRTDSQTLMGKLPFKIAQLAAKYGKECVLISGSTDGTKIGTRQIILANNDEELKASLAHPKEVLASKAKLILK